MDVTPLIRKGTQIIQSYSGGGFKISGQSYDGPVIIRPDRTLIWNVENKEHLRFDDFAPFLEEGRGAFDVLLLGTGSRLRFPPPDLRKALKEAGVSPDTMDTGAACRTYNVLAAEGRLVAAALLPSE